MDTNQIEEIVVNLKKAMEGFGTDNNALINIVTSHTIIERQKIKMVYQKKYKSDLIQDLKDELSSNYESAMIALFTNPIEYDAQQLHTILAKSSPNLEFLIEIIVTKPNWVLKQIKDTYKKLYQKEIEEDFNELKEEENILLTSLLKCQRNENDKPDNAECSNKAKELSISDTNSWKNPNSLFMNLITDSSPMELALIVRYYFKLTGKTIKQTINEVFEGEMKQLYNQVLYALISPSEFYATRIKKAIEGFGTDDVTLIRILVSRDEIDMDVIQQFYKQLYKKDLIDDIISDCSGDYEKLLVALVGH